MSLGNFGGGPQLHEISNPDHVLSDADGRPLSPIGTGQGRMYSYQEERTTANFGQAVSNLEDQAAIEQQHRALLEARSQKVSAQTQFKAADDPLGLDIENEEYSPKVKKQLFLACLFALLIGNMMLLNVASFLPTFIQQTQWDNNAKLQGFDTSLIISVFSVAQIVFAPFNSVIKNAIGSKNTINIGFFLLTVTTFALGWISVITNAAVFKWVAIVVRFFQGLGDILLQVTSYTIITTVFSDDVMKYISYIEITVGLGLGLGPALGSVIDTQVGYEMTMYIFGFLNLFGLIICIFYLPSQLNQTSKEAESGADVSPEDGTAQNPEADQQNNKLKTKLTWIQILKNRHFVFALVACFFGTTNLVYFQGYIAPYLGKSGFEEEQVGYVMAIQQVTYLPMCLILPHFCETQFPRKLQFVIAIFGFAICCFMMGPSEILGFPESYWIIIMAFPLIGVFQYFVFIPIIPEMLERVTVELNAVEGVDPELDAAIYDKVNDAYGFIYALAMFVGPLVGGFMHDQIGPRKTGDYVAISNLVIGGILLVFNCGIFVFHENRAFFSKLNELKAKAENLKGDDDESIDENDNSINNPAPNVLSKSLFKSMLRDDTSAKSGQPARARVPHLNYNNGTSQQQKVVKEQKRKEQMKQLKNSHIIYTDGLSYDGRSTANVSARTYNAGH